MISVPPEPSGEKVSQKLIMRSQRSSSKCAEIDRVYLCVCDGGGGEKHFSRDILNCFLKDYNIFPLIPYQAVQYKMIRYSFFMCVLVNLSFFLHLTESAFFLGGGGVGVRMRPFVLVPRHFSVLLLEPFDEGILIDGPL